MAEIFEINVSGRIYQISKTLLNKFPNSRLTKSCFSPDGYHKEMIFERPIQPFEAILEYYQTGSLHIPNSGCYISFCEELKFWGFSELNISTCCKRKLASFRSEQRDLDKYEQADKKYYKQYVDNSCCFGTTRMIIWNCLDNYDYNIVAKIMFILSICVVLLSTTVSILLTHPSFDVPLKTSHWKIYFGDDYEANKAKIRVVDLYRQGKITRESDHNFTHDAIVELATNVRNANPIFIHINWVCMAYFTVEMILRLLLCPSYRYFFSYVLNWIDVISLLLSYSEVLVQLIYRREMYEKNMLGTIQVLKVLRVVRLFRLTRNVTGARVLMFAVTNSVRELFFMMVLLGITSIMFGTLLYCVNPEAVDNIPYATWWAIITMTTVGYGDVVPNNDWGRLLGILCASCGIVLIALTVPLFVNNFLTVYTYAQSKQLLEEVHKNNAITVHPQSSTCNDKPIEMMHDRH